MPVEEATLVPSVRESGEKSNYSQGREGFLTTMKSHILLFNASQCKILCKCEWMFLAARE